MSLKWPLLTLLLGLIPVLALLVRRFKKHPKRPQFVAEAAGLEKLADYKKTVSRSKRFRLAETAMLVVIVAGFAVLVGRPQVAVTSYNQESSRDIVLCLDVSSSMEKYVPFAIDALESIYKQNPSDRYSIVVFAGRSATVLPLTRDPVAIQQKIDLLREVYAEREDTDTASLNFKDLPGYGSDIGEGVLGAVNRFDDLETYKSRNIILVSDLDQVGGYYDNEGKEYLDKVSLVAQNRINMFILRTPAQYGFATSPEQIIAVSGAQVYEVDKNNIDDSAKQLLPQIFTQVLNINNVASVTKADYPYITIIVVAVAGLIWTIIVARRWRAV